MSVIKGDKSVIEDLNSKEKVLVDFYASWCGPCRMLAPNLEEFSSKIDFDIVKIDIDEEEEVARKNGIMVVPTLILFKNGKEESRKTGLLTVEELEEWLVKNK